MFLVGFELHGMPSRVLLFQYVCCPRGLQGRDALGSRPDYLYPLSRGAEVHRPGLLP